LLYDCFNTLATDNTEKSNNSVLSLDPPKLGFCLSQLNLEIEDGEYIGGIFVKGKISALIGESGKGKK